LTKSVFLVILKKILNSMLKSGKQLKLNLFDNYKITTGTVDNKNPKAMYITISAWAKPKKNSEVNYSHVIKNMNKRLKSLVFENLDKNLFEQHRTIIDLDMRNSGISYYKKSYMNCEITLFKLNDFKIHNKQIKEELNKIINKIILDVFEESEYFEFHKNKK
jgi:hypothetical protein